MDSASNPSIAEQDYFADAIQYLPVEYKRNFWPPQPFWVPVQDLFTQIDGGIKKPGETVQAWTYPSSETA